VTLAELARDIALALISKSGVREWADPEVRNDIASAAVEMAAAILGEDPGVTVAVSAVLREQTGTARLWQKTGGDAAMTPSTLANGAYWEGAKLDLGATRAQVYAVYLDLELQATPTAGNTVDVWLNFSGSGTAGTDNGGGCSGTDATYAGYSSNAAASVKQLVFVGGAVVTTQVSATVQKRVFVGYVAPTDRYVSPVILNGSGAAFQGGASPNFNLRMVPVEFTSEPS
jgi:hypothetical protein